MDREWMNLSLTDIQYIKDVKTFIDAAKVHARVGNVIFCPCKDCNNVRKILNPETIRSHLVMRGFMPNYVVWCRHGKVGVNVAQGNNEDDPKVGAIIQRIS